MLLTISITKGEMFMSVSETETNTGKRTKLLTATAVFMAMVIALSSFGIPVPGGHLYLNDIVITTAALLLDGPHAFVACGIGAFIGDLLFYPAPMFVSLVTHGLQAVVISRISHSRFPVQSKHSGATAVLVGAIINVIGYTAGRAYIYATPEAAGLKFPFQMLQAGVGAFAGWLLVYRIGLKEKFRQYLR